MKILTIANRKEGKFLREKTKPFNFSKHSKSEVRELVKNMREIMRSAPGIGLAANQIGLDFGVFVAQVPRSRDQASDGKFYAIFNPRIVKASEEKKILEEGCLSVPDVYGLVERSSRVVLEGQDAQGRRIKIKAWGLLAQVFQHEADHLNGKLFIDKKNVKTFHRSSSAA